MTSFFAINDENKLATLLGSCSFLVEEFVPRSKKVVLDATIETLVIKFDYGKYKEFLHNNESLSPSKFKSSSFRKARRVGSNSIPLNGVNISHGVADLASLGKNTSFVGTDAPASVCGSAFHSGIKTSSRVRERNSHASKIGPTLVSEAKHMPFHWELLLVWFHPLPVFHQLRL